MAWKYGLFLDTHGQYPVKALHKLDARERLIHMPEITFTNGFYIKRVDILCVMLQDSRGTMASQHFNAPHTYERAPVLAVLLYQDRFQSCARVLLSFNARESQPVGRLSPNFIFLNMRTKPVRRQ